MKRYHARKKAVGVSLFPFLAVLICTMGALIVLLVLVVQMARVDASERPPQPPDDAALEKENYQWRLGLLQQERQTLAEDAQRNLAELSHLEQHIRELEKRWKQLVAEATDLKQRVGTGPGDVTATRHELARVQAAITTAKQELDAARRHAAQQPPVYCIVPYDGPNGTHRQPVYLECTQQGIVVQPDGIILRQRDLEGPLGAGNPLDAVLRAVRKYHGELQGTTTSNAYPLLVVRPDGAESYVLARAAMRVWDDEFGYELIDAQKQLQFPPVDPRRAELLRKVVDDARSRQAILVAAMPSRYQQRGSESGYVAAPRSGGEASGRDRTAPRGSRTGGFGRGGDTRYIDGTAAQAHLPDADPESQQSVGGPVHEGVAGGNKKANIGMAADPLAKQRGRNWGLPQANDGGTGIIRPIRVACLEDRLILLPDLGIHEAPDVILINGSMIDEIDTLVGKIWEQVDTWGIAVTGGYWKPILHVDVPRGAEWRFEELKTLLLGSGLEVQRTTREKTSANAR